MTRRKQVEKNISRMSLVGVSVLGIAFSIALMVINYNYNDSSSRSSLFWKGIFYCIVFVVLLGLEFIMTFIL